MGSLISLPVKAAVSCITEFMYSESVRTHEAGFRQGEPLALERPNAWSRNTFEVGSSFVWRMDLRVRFVSVVGLKVLGDDWTCSCCGARIGGLGCEGSPCRAGQEGGSEYPAVQEGGSEYLSVQAGGSVGRFAIAFRVNVR